MKAAIFDIGGVIIDMEGMVTPTLEIFRPQDPGEFWEYFNISILPACRGEEPVEDALGRICDENGIPDFRESLYTLWIEDYRKHARLNKEVVRIIGDLRVKCKLGIISNTINEHVPALMSYPAMKIFDEVILSSEVHMTKDQKEIFLLAAEKLGVPPSECIFIDDVSAFVEVAKEVGMKGIVFRDAKQLGEELKKLV